jgi:DNA-binding Lrp family transcriptional regulator
LIREDGRFEVGEIAEVTGITESTVHEIISDLNLRKIFIRWDPKMLVEEHKSKRMTASRSLVL